MPIRTVKQHTDRGSIKDLAVRANTEIVEYTPSELRMKRLYEYAQVCKNKELQDSLGFITTEYISDKNALPLSVYHLRKIVEDIKSKSGDKINEMQNELSNCFGSVLSAEAAEYIDRRQMIKTAGTRKPPVFWRVSKP